MISVIDDDESMRDSARQLLRSAGYRVATFDSAGAFLESRSIEESLCIILDLKMPGIDGLELQRRLNTSGAEVPIVFVTAHDDAQNRRRALEAGAVDFLGKPFNPSMLLATIATALGAITPTATVSVLHFGYENCHRLMVLRKAGYSVHECPTEEELIGLAKMPIDLVCISEGFKTPTTQALLLTRRHFPAPIVLFRRVTRSGIEFDFDLEIEPLTSPSRWLSDIQKIILGSKDLRRTSKELLS